ncbi:hypothetical protein MesoLjLb_23670 [Mesorhizobium sp. L-8-3]|nr:hypothetical protein MesoLjLb_23670 [Mesorhizobium sp. L-8-3]
MFVKPAVGGRNQLPVESTLATAGFITADKHDRPPGRIERKGDTPDPTIGREAELFHVTVFRTMATLEGYGDLCASSPRLRHS